MPRQFLGMITLTTCLLANWCNPASALAADSTKFTTPAEAISAAEDAFGKGKFEAYADCFDAEGQKQMVSGYVGMFAMAISEGAGPDAKKIKDLLAKHGVIDVAKKAGETDEQLADRLAAKVKGPRAFMIEAIPVLYSGSGKKVPIKGALKDVKIDGQNAQADYVVKPLGDDTAMTQQVAFTQANGSWRISKTFLLAFPPEK